MCCRTDLAEAKREDVRESFRHFAEGDAEVPPAFGQSIGVIAGFGLTILLILLPGQKIRSVQDTHFDGFRGLNELRCPV